MSFTKKGIFDQAKKFIEDLNNNKGKANKIIDNLNVKQNDKTIMKDLLGKSDGNLNKADQDQVLNLIKSMVAQGGNDPAKKKKAAETIKKLNLRTKIKPENRKLYDEILEMLEK